MNKFVGTLATIFFGILILLSSLLYQGCGNKSSTDNAVSATYSSLYSNVFSQSCVQCHQPGGSAEGNGAEVDFSSQSRGYSSLTTGTVKGVEAGSNCSGINIVSEGSATTSYMVGLLVSSENGRVYGSNCTAIRTHIEANYLSSEAANALIQWVNEGAQNN